MTGSFLRHELAHIAVWQILGREAERLPHEWREFIAYAIQLDLLDPEVNEFTYGMNPDVFAVGAYLTYSERGAERFVRAVARRDYPAPFVDPFPVLPEQSPR